MLCKCPRSVAGHVPEARRLRTGFTVTTRAAMRCDAGLVPFLISKTAAKTQEVYPFTYVRCCSAAARCGAAWRSPMRCGAMWLATKPPMRSDAMRYAWRCLPMPTCPDALRSPMRCDGDVCRLWPDARFPAIPKSIARALVRDRIGSQTGRQFPQCP